MTFRPIALTHALLTAILTSAALCANGPMVEVGESPRSPYAALRQTIAITVGESVSLVTATLDYYYVREYDADDGLNPFIIDLPVLVRAEDTDPGAILKMVNARLEISGDLYRPRSVLLLDHTAFEPVPDVPLGARIALVSFSIPRKSLKPRFKAFLAYDQPHLPMAEEGSELTGYVPMLPDVGQLSAVHRFKDDDFTVTFTALPGVELRRDSVNHAVVTDDPETITIRARHRESMLVVAAKAPRMTE